MITTLAALALNLSMPVGMNVEIANCTNIALIRNDLNEHSARFVKVGSHATIDGKVVTVKRGDSIWGLCRVSTGNYMKEVSKNAYSRQKMIEQIAKIDRERMQLQLETMELERIYARLPAGAKHNPAVPLWLRSVRTWLSLGFYR